MRRAVVGRAALTVAALVVAVNASRAGGTPTRVSLHDRSVLFDDDGTTWVVRGYRDLHLAQLNATLTDTVPGTTRALVARAGDVGERVAVLRAPGEPGAHAAHLGEATHRDTLAADRAVRA